MAEDRKRLEEIHRETVIVDAHLDLSCDLYKQHLDGVTHVIQTQYLEDFQRGGVNVIIATIFVDTKDLPEAALKSALGQIASLYAELEECQDSMALCVDYQSLKRTVDTGKIAILLSFEGVEPLGDNLELLRLFYQLGVRGVGLCWSRRNNAADGGLYSDVEQGQSSGLTNFGYQLIREAERLGMFIDVSHLNDEGFEDVMKLTKKPFIASHSNCRTLHKTKRNLTDRQIKAIAAKNGVIGMNGCSSILADSLEKANVETMVDHIDHIVGLVGIRHVGLGFDFCERVLPPNSYIEVNDQKVKALDVIKGYAGLYELTRALLDRGYCREEVELIYGGNFLRVFYEILS